MNSGPSLYKAVIFGILLVSVLACQSGNQKVADTDTPNAVRDLLIDRIFWKRVPTGKAGEAPLNLHRFTITNTSPKYSYSKIDVRFDYYDRAHHKIDSAEQTVERTLEPRAAISIGELPTSPAKPETTSATITVLTAVGKVLP